MSLVAYDLGTGGEIELPARLKNVRGVEYLVTRATEAGGEEKIDGKVMYRDGSSPEERETWAFVFSLGVREEDGDGDSDGA